MCGFVIKLYVVFLLGCLKFQQMLCQFAPHMDLQKIDEIMFDQAKYSVLKPTIHITRDHFKDFIQKRDNTDFPGRKLFIDRNGIRHYWTGFEARRPKSLRKTILETTDNILFNKNTMSTNIISVTGKDNKLDIDNQAKFNNSKKSEEDKKVKNKPRRKKKVTGPDDKVSTSKDKLVLRDDNGRTKVMTTFFCPFFGVVTMVSYID